MFYLYSFNIRCRVRRCLILRKTRKIPLFCNDRRNTVEPCNVTENASSNTMNRDENYATEIGETLESAITILKFFDCVMETLSSSTKFLRKISIDLRGKDGVSFKKVKHYFINACILLYMNYFTSSKVLNGFFCVVIGLYSLIIPITFGVTWMIIIFFLLIIKKVYRQIDCYTFED